FRPARARPERDLRGLKSVRMGGRERRDLPALAFRPRRLVANQARQSLTEDRLRLSNHLRHHLAGRHDLADQRRGLTVIYDRLISVPGSAGLTHYGDHLVSPPAQLVGATEPTFHDAITRDPPDCTRPVRAKHDVGEVRDDRVAPIAVDDQLLESRVEG